MGRERFSQLAANNERKGWLKRIIGATKIFDAGAILYGLTIGNAIAVILGLTGLIVKNEFLEKEKTR